MAAGNAQRSADQAQENARALEVQSSQASDIAGRARQGLAVIKSAQEAQSSLGATADRVVKAQQSTETAITSKVTPAVPAAVSTPTATPFVPSSTASPVVNTQGETTGRFINTTA